MLNNYIKIALRSFTRNKSTTAINIFGLAISFACVTIILLVSAREMNYDSFHDNGDRIYRVNYDETKNNPSGRRLATTSPPMGPALQTAFPEIEYFTRLRFSDGDVISYNDHQFYENDIIYADSSFFHMFSYPFIAGDKSRALNKPNSVVITEDMAEKYFGVADPLGKTLRLNNDEHLEVTGVVSTENLYSHLEFDFIVSFTTFRVPAGYPVTLDDWRWISFHTYLQLTNKTNALALESKLPAFLEEHYPEKSSVMALSLQPIKDIYLGDLKHEDIKGGNKNFPYGLIAVGILILLLAVVNYVNLALARSLTRSREVGIRKVNGALKIDLIRQFIGESIITCFISSVISAVLVELFHGIINSFYGISVYVGGEQFLMLVAAGILFSILIGLIAGFYPAFIASGFEPVKVLKGSLTGGGKDSGILIRRLMIALQFCITVGLIASTIIINGQMSFIQNKDLGFDDEEVIILQMIRDGSDQFYPALKNRLSQNPDVVTVSAGSGLLDGNNGSVPVFYRGSGDEESIVMDIYGVQYNYFNLLDIEVLDGRTFSEDYVTDSEEGIILNEKAVKLLGLEEPIDYRLRISNLVDGRIIGIVNDFHFASLHDEVNPLAVFMTEYVENIYVKVKPGNAEEILASLENSWIEVLPNQPFNYKFLNSHLEDLYQKERQLANMIAGFSVIAVIIGCLGLYGLIVFFTRQKVREVGIRKVLGASVGNIIYSLSFQFLILILIANLIAIPVTYYVMENWLNNFAYRININVWYMMSATALSFIFAGFAIGSHVIKAAVANPVDSLRDE